MDTSPLHIQLLGGFSIRCGDTRLDIGIRSRKLCLLLACLIQNRDHPIPYKQLHSLLWGDQAESPRTSNALKASLHRARTCLDQLGPNAGQLLILNRRGCCQWNPEFPVTLDVEQFSRLCQEGASAGQEEQRLELWTQALGLYRGDYLPTLAGHPWAAPQAQALRQLRLQTTLDTLPLLAGRQRWQETADLAGAASASDPFHEQLCRWQMQALIQLDCRRDAARCYESFQERLLVHSGVLPSDQLRELYRETQHTHDPRALSPVTLLERLQEPPRPGALICEYDFFRIVCHSMVRMAGRSGEPLHVALLSVTGPEEAPLPRHSLKRVMDNLQGIILSHLRRGDTAARCSSSQFVLLLPQTSYENGQTVCTRITKAFIRQFPHSPAQIHISVQPLLPSR